MISLIRLCAPRPTTRERIPALARRLEESIPTRNRQKKKVPSVPPYLMTERRRWPR
jgi:hypothetical protein